MTMQSTGGALPQKPSAQESKAKSEKPINVGSSERWLSAVGGGAIALYGLKRGGVGGTALALLGGGMIYRGSTGHCSTYAALGMTTAHPAEPKQYFERGIHVDEVVTIRKTPWELYEYWKNFENLPKFMSHLISVEKLDEKKSRWTARAPMGLKVSWDAEIINDEPNALIAWRSLGGATVDNAGSVRFVPSAAGDGTEVRVVLDYIPPAGQVASWFAKLFGEEPSQSVRDDLQRFKQIMESVGAPAIGG